MMVTWAHREEQFVMGDDDTLSGLLGTLKAQNAATMPPDRLILCDVDFPTAI